MKIAHRPESPLAAKMVNTPLKTEKLPVKRRVKLLNTPVHTPITP